MAYLVSLSDRARRDIAALYKEKNVASSTAAARWFNGLETAVLTLEKLPQRCPAAPERGPTKRPLRHLLYGKKPHVYRVLYEIAEPSNIVRIITIRHGAMDLAILP